MAEAFHSLYCFDSLVAHFEKRKPIPLQTIDRVCSIMLYEEEFDTKLGPDGQVLAVNGAPVEPQIVELPKPKKLPNSPLFVTWNKESSQHKLRGCIGTFEPQALESGLQQYALTAALEDTRFNPIRARDLPDLSCAVSILTDFEPAEHSMDWEHGIHGLRISFVYHGRRLGATYLPDVPVEQGWTKEETLISLMRKAGWSGRESEWKKVELDVTRYKGTKASVTWEQYRRVVERCLTIEVRN
ncbi:hypothetical protein L211DRAFT_866135 [Terfezia boudieri ATCC MYA-4762]|uniref:AMMECR1 domain-containing protein n=1 Tax=Terfezia boudieri ATCC MYA-4762 TaxID=1051890 RepID=A0A3N4LQ60_9PEZI|nr:hypothetical protein L211DRAFT_839171 [Terfezia boudieri ATCC MYA-4762]RPB26625.1 hypothetical protein L211DRAFT_866135 [Terfezia boudieri ATCC MYA-4762]